MSKKKKVIVGHIKYEVSFQKKILATALSSNVLRGVKRSMAWGGKMLYTFFYKEIKILFNIGKA